jgi:succinate-semialdehyde dehydrogenase/glutarate-semialdehyde dehydrogenase
MPHNLLIDNVWRDAASRRTMDVVNPATEEVIAQVAWGGAGPRADSVRGAPAGRAGAGGGV